MENATSLFKSKFNSSDLCSTFPFIRLLLHEYYHWAYLTCNKALEMENIAILHNIIQFK